MVTPPPLPESAVASTPSNRMSRIPTRVVWLALPAVAVCLAIAAWWVWPRLRGQKDAEPVAAASNAGLVSMVKTYVRLKEGVKRIDSERAATLQQADLARPTGSPPVATRTPSSSVPPPADGPKPTLASPPTATPPKAFPKLKLQGIVFNQSQPSAIVNGQTVVSGEKVGPVTVVSITRDSVTLDHQGEVRVLSLK